MHKSSTSNNSSNKIIKKKKDRPIPAFLTKLYLIVDDKETDDIIKWGEDNQSFLVLNSEEFSQKILPKYFKHSNFTSFVRQLNMYGFHKVSQVTSNANHYEFRNENFIKQRQDLLSSIAKTREDKQPVHNLTNPNLQELLVEIGQIKVQQQAIQQDILQIQQSNQAMWEQSMMLSRYYHSQKDTIEKIVGFLASVFTKGKKGTEGVSSGDVGGVKRLLNAEVLTDEENEFVKREISTLLQPNPIPIPAAPPTIPDFDNLGTRAANLSQDIEMMQDRLLDISDLVGMDHGLWNDQGPSGLTMEEMGQIQGLNVDTGMNGLNDIQGLSTPDINLTTPLVNGHSPIPNPVGDIISPSSEYVEPKELNFEDFFNDQHE